MEGKWKDGEYHDQGTITTTNGKNGQVISEGINLGTSHYFTKKETSI